LDRFAGFSLGGWNPAIFSISSGQPHRKYMSDTIQAALIGIGGVLAGILVDKLFFLLTERQRSKKEFFKDFFPERLKAHQKILGVITKYGFDYLDPERLGRPAVEVVLKEARQQVEAVFFETLLVAEKHVSGALLDLSRIISETLKIEADFEKKGLFGDSLKRLQLKDYELMKLLRENSGIDIIDQEFGKMLDKRDNVVEEGKDNLDGDIPGDESSP